jgi:glutathione S-transferase
MIIVHHLNNSRSQRILWMLEELGVPYDVKRYEREPSMQAPASLRAVHPLGKSPVITDGDRTLAESGAILEYLVDTYGNGRFRPATGTPEKINYTYFLHYAEGSLMPLLLMKLIFSRIPARLPIFMRPVGRAIAKGANTTLLDPQIGSHFMFLESELGKREWFAGADFSAADIQMSFPLEAAAARGGLEQGHPRAMAFLERIHARPAYNRALEKGGPYTVGR